MLSRLYSKSNNIFLSTTRYNKSLSTIMGKSLPSDVYTIKFPTRSFSTISDADIIPKSYSTAADFNMKNTYSSLPVQAWNMGLHLYKKSILLGRSIDLLSEADNVENHQKVELMMEGYSQDIPDSSIANLQKEHTRLSSVVEIMEDLFNKRTELVDLHEMLLEAQNEVKTITDTHYKNGGLQQDLLTNEDLISWTAVSEQTAEEITSTKAYIDELESDLLDNVLPKDVDDHRNAILEVRPGTGGDEAMLFARDIFDMYANVSREMGWRFEVQDVHVDERGGYREASAAISGDSVFGALKFETGVHRVQRIPITETLGRVHTSTMTVAVLPEVEAVDIVIKESDLKIDVYRASGAGGQHVNTTESAVRITHLPTGTIVTNQDQRSQHKNKEKAMNVLRARIYENQRQKNAEERARIRGEQIGSGDRSERIRTYNFPQSRVTDHRINVTLHSVENFLAGETFPEMLEKLKHKERMDILASALKDDKPMEKTKKK